MQTYVTPLGFDSTPVTRPVLRYGLSEGDRVVLLRPADGGTDRGTEAVRDVRQLLGEAAAGVDVTVVELTVTDFAATVRATLDVFQAADGELVVGFGGGPRELLVPMVVATLVVRDRVSFAYQFADIERSAREVAIPDLTTPVGESTMETLRAVADAGGETTLPELAEGEGPSKSTIGRHLDELAAAGAVRTQRHGKTRVVEVTLGGELRLAARGARGDSE